MKTIFKYLSLRSSNLTLYIFFAFFSIPLIYSCNSETKKTASKKTIIENQYVIDESIKISDDQFKTIKKVYVKDISGIDIKQHADSNSETIGNFFYGEEIAVIEDIANWYGVKYLITKRQMDNGKYRNVTELEKVYVPKNKTGNKSDIKRLFTDLSVIEDLKINDKRENFKDGRILTDYIKIEEIDSTTFYNKKSHAIGDYFTPDTNRFKKHNGVLKIKYKSGEKVFKDIPPYDERYQKCSYIGEIKVVNKYVIHFIFIDDEAYKLVDKENGEESPYFLSFPLISPDKKHFISVRQEVYENTGEIKLCSFDNNHIKEIFLTNFKNWMPSNPDNMFWSNDGYFYVSINRITEANDIHTVHDEEISYIRIKLI